MEVRGDSREDLTRPEPSGERGLVIGKSTKGPLTKAQQAFNRLIKKIEKLRRSIEEETDRLNRLLTFYSLELHPLEMRILQQRKSLVRRLYPFLKSREIPGRKQRGTLRMLISEQLDAIRDIERELKDDDLKSIAEQLGKATLRTPSEEDLDFLEELKSRAQADFRDMGVDVDLSKFRPGMSPEELFETLAEVESKLKEGDEPGAASRRKSKRESREEERTRLEEELRQRDLGSLYKQLAKMLHPDLEPDPVLRVEKEAAMKRLTTAYKAKDLHGILRLELEWISREQADVTRLTEEKLRVYNGILREQADELQARVHEVAMHPRFGPLAPYAHPLFGPGHLDPDAVRRQLTAELTSMIQLVEVLEGSEALQEVRAMIREARDPWSPPPPSWVWQ